MELRNGLFQLVHATTVPDINEMLQEQERLE
jgi:hypothetical protein